MKRLFGLGTYLEDDEYSRPVGGKVLCSDYRVRALRNLSVPDTYFSRTGAVKVSGRVVTGIVHVTHSTVMFTSTGKNKAMLPPWDLNKLVGLSASRCIKDMIYGDVTHDEVAFLYPSTYIQTEYDRDYVTARYSDSWWAKDPKSAATLLKNFISADRYYQWREKNWPDVMRLPRDEVTDFIRSSDGKKLLLANYWVKAGDFFKLLEEAHKEEGDWPAVVARYPREMRREARA